ncbi:RICIN domain-containing protein [Streptomyces virginiae]|uniref:RICIN domain-containing protein n=1 Tax=Streptomyces virginiae TaxID=1961 RepID=UPI0034360714
MRAGPRTPWRRALSHKGAALRGGGAAPAGAAAANQILNWNSDLCLGINGGGEWGRTAIQWDCNGNDDRTWYFGQADGSATAVRR